MATGSEKTWAFIEVEPEVAKVLNQIVGEVPAEWKTTTQGTARKRFTHLLQTPRFVSFVFAIPRNHPQKIS